MKSTPLSVYVPNEHWERMHEFVKLCPDEIGGVGLVEDTGDYLILGKPMLLKQTASPVEVTLDPLEVQQFLQQSKLLTGEALPTVNFYLWHSHASMAVGWSSTDEKWIKNFINRGWLVSLCLNKKRDYSIRTDTLVGSTIEDACLHYKPETKLFVEYPEVNVKDECAAEFAEKVVRVKYDFGKGKGKKWKKGNKIQLPRYTTDRELLALALGNGHITQAGYDDQMDLLDEEETGLLTTNLKWASAKTYFDNLNNSWLKDRTDLILENLHKKLPVVVKFSTKGVGFQFTLNGHKENYAGILYSSDIEKALCTRFRLSETTFRKFLGKDIRIVSEKGETNIHYKKGGTDATIKVR